MHSDEWKETCVDRLVSKGAFVLVDDEAGAWASYLPTTTVQAPHPPSPHPSFVPVKPLLRMNSRSVRSKSSPFADESWKRVLLTLKTSLDASVNWVGSSKPSTDLVAVVGRAL